MIKPQRETEIGTLEQFPWIHKSLSITYVITLQLLIVLNHTENGYSKLGKTKGGVH